ncbi:MAG: 3-deoxy-D-manno-octulosonic acid transferase [Ignavibacteriales bacterium]|nr:3-deoxy-D-manno-octulosonic acid transferase [Ignavibacteriales bacterium]
MSKIWFFLYNAILIPLLFVFFVIASLVNYKIKRGLQGRKNWQRELKAKLEKLDKGKKTIWFHSSSMGEFEQAKPIIEQIKKQNKFNIIVSFYSPSGYENSLKYPFPDVITYMPFDSPGNAKKFLTLVHPHLAVFMRYDIWPNFIWQLKKQNIPSFIVDATMRKNSKRKWFLIKSLHKSIYKSITKILTVSKDDLDNFLDFDIEREKLKVVGDTRFDRVYQKSLDAKEKKLFSLDFFVDKKVFVFGSSWEADENVIFPAFEKLAKYDENIIMIVAPHEPTLLHLEKIENEFADKLKTIRFSFINNYKYERIIIIDSIGILLTLYYYANVAFVGGSFKQGIHNVLEPAVYGIPVLFGPKIQNSQEAQELEEIGGGIVIRNRKEAYRTLRQLFWDEEFRKESGNICFNYVNTHIGATKKIFDEINLLNMNSTN